MRLRCGWLDESNILARGKPKIKFRQCDCVAKKVFAANYLIR